MNLLTGTFGSLLLMFTIGYLLLLLYAWLMQSRLLYLPNLPGRVVSITPAHAGLRYEDVNLVTSDGVRLHGWYLAAPTPSTSPYTLLFFHGNAGNISHRLESLRLFHSLGLAVLIFDYRGYGNSKGTPTEAGTHLDAEAAWRYLTGERQVAPDRLLLFGRSLGGAVAARLAAQHPPAALILESTYTSVPDLAAEHYPFLPVRLLSRFHYDTRQVLANVHCPVLVIHSREDEIVPFHHAEALLAAAASPKELLVIRGGHNEGFWISRRIYLAGWQRFLASLPPPPAAGSDQ